VPAPAPAPAVKPAEPPAPPPAAAAKLEADDKGDLPLKKKGSKKHVSKHRVH
jgi:hypothetical protein